ncbi:MAG: VOC family protein [Nevskia sp.]|nr:VOC family protein [Nevskia sp.]
MKRFHVHVAVDDLRHSIRFYSAMFGAAPTVEKPDYAKWMLDDPRLNFAISQRGAAAGVNHLGIQVESADELEGLRQRAAAAGIQARDEAGASCCYARSDKYWVQDPQGIAWETFHTLGEIPLFGEHAAGEKTARAACCAPEAPISFTPRPKH